MILTIISSILVILTLHSAYKDFRKDSSFIKNVYLTRPLDYLWGLIIFFFVATIVVGLSILNLPNFLYWSWISLISENQNGGNVITLGFSSQSVLFILFFWLVLCLCLPYLAKAEEISFRSKVFGVRKRVISNLIFGVLHMIMGVPFIISVVIGILGFVFSIFYVNQFNRHIHLGHDESDEIATFVTTSIHTKYNFFIITIAAVVSILSVFYS